MLPGAARSPLGCNVALCKAARARRYWGREHERGVGVAPAGGRSPEHRAGSPCAYLASLVKRNTTNLPSVYQVSRSGFVSLVLNIKATRASCALNWVSRRLWLCMALISRAAPSGVAIASHALYLLHGLNFSRYASGMELTSHVFSCERTECLCERTE